MLVGHATLSNDYFSSIDVISKNVTSFPNKHFASFPVGSHSELEFKDGILKLTNVTTGQTKTFECNNKELYIWFGVNDIIFSDKIIEQMKETNKRKNTEDASTMLLTYFKDDKRLKSLPFRAQFGFTDNIGLFTVSCYKRSP